MKKVLYVDMDNVLVDFKTGIEKLDEYIIDDRTKNGIEHFEGEHIHFGTEQFPDWDSVRSYLMGE